MSQSGKEVLEVMSLPKAPQVFSRNEMLSPEILKNNSSFSVRVFRNGLSFFFLLSWACFLHLGSLQPFLELGDALLIPPSPSPPRIYAFIYLHMYSWNKQPVETFCSRCCRHARKLEVCLLGLLY